MGRWTPALPAEEANAEVTAMVGQGITHVQIVESPTMGLQEVGLLLTNGRRVRLRGWGYDEWGIEVRVQGDDDG